MDVDLGFNYFEEVRSGSQWYMMESKDFTSNINFYLKNGNGDIVPFTGQLIAFRLSIRENYFF